MRPPEEGEATRLVFLGPRWSQPGAETLRRCGLPEADGKRDCAPGSRQRAQQPRTSYRLAGSLSRPQLGLRVPDSAAGTAVRPPSPRRVCADTFLPPAPPHPHVHGAGCSPFHRLHALRGSVTLGVVATTSGSGVGRPHPPRSRPQSCSGCCAPGTTLGVCIVFGQDLRGGWAGWRERGWAGWRERDQGFRVTVARQRLLWARKRQGRGQLLAEKAPSS